MCVWFLLCLGALYVIFVSLFSVVSCSAVDCLRKTRDPKWPVYMSTLLTQLNSIPNLKILASPLNVLASPAPVPPLSPLWDIPYPPTTVYDSRAYVRLDRTYVRHDVFRRRRNGRTGHSVAVRCLSLSKKISCQPSFKRVHIIFSDRLVSHREQMADCSTALYQQTANLAVRVRLLSWHPDNIDTVAQILLISFFQLRSDVLIVRVSACMFVVCTHSVLL